MLEAVAGFIIAGMIILAACVTAIVIARRRRSPERRLRQFIASISQDWMSRCLLPDGVGGEIYVDYLLLTHSGFMVVESKDVTGTVFAGDRLDTWSATSVDGRVEFDNPIPSLLNRIAAVEQLAPGIPVVGRILFHESVAFPKGHPDVVATAESLAREFDDHGPADSLALDRWVEIKAQVSFT